MEKSYYILNMIFVFAQSAGAVVYTDYTSEEE